MVPGKGVRYREVSAIKHVSYREVPLYCKETCANKTQFLPGDNNLPLKDNNKRFEFKIDKKCLPEHISINKSISIRIFLNMNNLCFNG